MATYYDGNNNNSNNSEIQSSPQGLQTLYLMNPNYALPFSSDSTSSHNPTPNTNILFLNPNNTANNNSTSPSGSTTHAHALNLASLSHAPPQHHQQQHHHHPVGVPIPASSIVGPTNATDEISAFHGFAAAGAGAPRVHYNLWGSIADQTPSSAAAASLASAVAVADAGTAAAEMGFRRPGYQQGLSLSLSSQQPPYRLFSGEMEGLSPASRGSSVHSVVIGSKYLRATQELLDEVVSVGKGVFSVEGSSNKEKMKGNMNSGVVGGDGSSGGGGGENSGGNNKQGGELSTAQRQELQMKKSKLVGMLDEVEQRYRQYHHQMQIVVSSFEQAAGYGAARSYTALALKTISKQFRSLKDTISAQIRATSKVLGEDDCLGAKAEGSRLRYVDHHLRQQRALQQLGMIQHNAWRPQRGLPERAVSVLRAWLFEHFLHPYPKDSDKVMLAKQTGLTRSQVSNWFINARVRLWKPMVEEMYTEEIKDQEENNNNGSSIQENTTINRSKESSSKELWSSPPSNDQINVLQSKTEGSFNNQSTPPTDHISNSNNNNNNSMPQSPMEEMKPSRGANNNNIDKFGIEIRRSHGGYGSLISMEDIGRFNHQHQQLAPRFHGNGVSLTLGLPPSDHHHNLPTQHGFLSQNNMHNLGGGPNENEFCPPPPPPPVPSSHSGNSYDHTIDMQNSKRFAAHLLRDFVA